MSYNLTDMWQNQVSIEINAPPETVYAYLQDLSRHSEWSSNVRKIELTNGAAGTVGAEYTASEEVPKGLTSYARITALDAPRRIAWQSTDHRVFRTEWEFLIAPKNGGTELTQHVEFYPLTLPANVILYLFRVPVVAKEDRASLERIKEHAERDAISA